MTSVASRDYSGSTYANTASRCSASSTDGVGTKLVIAQQMDVHDTVGIDLVAMVVDDLVACGAEPLFLLDYIACGEVVPEKVAAIGAGIADGCRKAGCSLLGGETAEHPGVLRPHEYDLSATGVGRSRGGRRAWTGPGRGRRRHYRDAVVRPARERVLPGAPRAAGRGAGASGHRDGRVRPPADARRGAAHADAYLRQGLSATNQGDRLRALAHITGGGVPGNLARVLPEHVDAVVDRSTWRPQPVFDLVQSKGRIEQSEMESTFNMGVGMMAIVAANDADRALAFLRGRGIDGWAVGEIIDGSGQVQMLGSYTRG